MTVKSIPDIKSNKVTKDINVLEKLLIVGRVLGLFPKDFEGTQKKNLIWLFCYATFYAAFICSNAYFIYITLDEYDLNFWENVFSVLNSVALTFCNIVFIIASRHNEAWCKFIDNIKKIDILFNNFKESYTNINIKSFYKKQFLVHCVYVAIEANWLYCTSISDPYGFSLKILTDIYPVFVTYLVYYMTIITCYIAVIIEHRYCAIESKLKHIITTDNEQSISREILKLKKINLLIYRCTSEFNIIFGLPILSIIVLSFVSILSTFNELLVYINSGYASRAQEMYAVSTVLQSLMILVCLFNMLF